MYPLFLTGYTFNLNFYPSVGFVGGKMGPGELSKVLLPDNDFVRPALWPDTLSASSKKAVDPYIHSH